MKLNLKECHIIQRVKNYFGNNKSEDNNNHQIQTPSNPIMNTLLLKCNLEDPKNEVESQLHSVPQQYTIELNPDSQGNPYVPDAISVKMKVNDEDQLLGYIPQVYVKTLIPLIKNTTIAGELVTTIWNIDSQKCGSESITIRIGVKKTE